MLFGFQVLEGFTEETDREDLVGNHGNLGGSSEGLGEFGVFCLDESSRFVCSNVHELHTLDGIRVVRQLVLKDASSYVSSTTLD